MLEYKEHLARKESSMDYKASIRTSKKIGIPVKKIIDMLFLLKKFRTIESNELLRKVGVSRNALNKTKKAISPLLKPVSETTELSPEGLRFVRDYISTNHVLEEEIWKILEGDLYKNTLSLLERHREKRPVPNRDYDQFPATLETTAMRVSLLDFFCEIRGKRLLFLGDDDLTSLGAASTRYAEEVVTLDIDTGVLDAIEHIRSWENLSLSTVHHDLRKTLPQQLCRKFDVIFTDPPYTPEGMSLFLSRAIQALDTDNDSARIYLCYGNSDRAKERFLPIQQLFIDAGLMQRWVFDKFNRYEGAESIGSASSLFVLETTPRTKPLIKGAYDQHLYTYTDE